MPTKASPIEFYGYTKAAGILREMITEAANDPAVIRKAIELVRPVDGGSFVDEAKALFQYVRDQIRYTNDVSGEDIYRTPQLTMDLRAGDCNNKVALGCSLAKAIGFPTRMVFVFSNPEGQGHDFPFHVYYQVNVAKDSENPKWISCETIPVPSGQAGQVGPDRLLPFGYAMGTGYPEYVEVDQ